MFWVLSLSYTDIIARVLSPGVHVHGIRSLIGVGKPVGPRVLSVLYLRDTRSEALPQ